MAAIALCPLEALPNVGGGLELPASLVEEYGYDQFQGTPQSIPVLTMGRIYLIGVPVVVIGALGFWALLQRNERLATLLAAVVPLAAFIGVNLLDKDTRRSGKPAPPGQLKLSLKHDVADGPRRRPRPANPSEQGAALAKATSPLAQLPNP